MNRNRSCWYQFPPLRHSVDPILCRFRDDDWTNWSNKKVNLVVLCTYVSESSQPKLRNRGYALGSAKQGWCGCRRRGPPEKHLNTPPPIEKKEEAFVRRRRDIDQDFFPRYYCSAFMPRHSCFGRELSNQLVVPSLGETPSTCDQARLDFSPDKLCGPSRNRRPTIDR